jgi:hypothetical protein
MALVESGREFEDDDNGSAFYGDLQRPILSFKGVLCHIPKANRAEVGEVYNIQAQKG